MFCNLLLGKQSKCVYSLQYNAKHEAIKRGLWETVIKLRRESGETAGPQRHVPFTEAFLG